ncbi:hypothetical protein Tco_0859195 [Tanacetum coccineum]|uniref:Uncharacterized protein n=1 Tax=Tanacetum coccineum TaxID=301880 RepID=A0ABQ5BF84_9ASTR
MEKSSNPTQIPSPPNVTPKEEHVTLDKSKSPNPFLLADQVSTPTGVVVRPWFATIRYNREIGAKGTLKKSCLPPSPHDGHLQVDVPLANKAPNTSSHDEMNDSRDLMFGAKVGTKKKHSKHNLGSKEEATKSQPSSKEVAHSPTGHSKNKKNFSTAKDKALSQPLVSTPVDTELHKEDLQAAGDPTSLGVTSEERAHPQLSSNKTKSDRDGLKTAHTDSGTLQSHILPYPKSIIFQELMVAEPKNIQWELPVEFLDLPSQVSLVHGKLKTLDSLLSLLNKVTDTLNRFSTMVKTASGAASKNVSSACQAIASPAEGAKNTNPATRDAEPTNLHNELVDLLGIDIMKQYYNKKLLYDKYCDNMLKRRKSSKIINCNVLTQKGPITLQVYREDEIVEVILNVKVSDLHLAE